MTDAPLTDAELGRLEMQNDVAGLSSIDVRKLVAEVRRLREGLDTAIGAERTRLDEAEMKVYAFVPSEEAALAYRGAQGRYSVLQELRQQLRGAILPAVVAHKTMEDLAKGGGFDDEADMQRLVVAVDLTRPGMLARFEAWKRDDGTKAGLLRLQAEVDQG